MLLKINEEQIKKAQEETVLKVAGFKQNVIALKTDLDKQIFLKVRSLVFIFYLAITHVNHDLGPEIIAQDWLWPSRQRGRVLN